MLQCNIIHLIVNYNVKKKKKKTMIAKYCFTMCTTKITLLNMRFSL